MKFRRLAKENLKSLAMKAYNAVAIFEENVADSLTNSKKLFVKELLLHNLRL